MQEFEELRRIRALADAFARANAPSLLRSETLAEVRHGGESYPLLAFRLGSASPDVPVLAFFGGVHGLERIGTQIATSFLESLVERLDWDRSLQWQLEKMRLVCVPLVNPVGMHWSRRANGNDVDLMRNSPVRARPATPLVGGQTVSRHLPWYMGEKDRMELESRVLCDLVERESESSPASILVDLHSGFGVVDRLWFPYARSQEPFPNLPEVFALKAMLDQAQPNHVYSFEPQAKSYTTHGDLWDYLYDRHRARDPGHARALIPLTLEMGSWLWVKKNPRQLFSLLGAFNPIKPHRQKRVLRRHIPLLDFLMRATLSHEPWSRLSPSTRGLFQAQASELWYRGE
jgi:hypothetical protein